MRCPACQQDNPPGARFCNGCGTRLELARPACRQLNPPGSRFCNGCGQSLTASSASPDTYTPRHLAEKILGSKSALEGERKQVTVLFADVKGSMELLADRDPEEGRKLLDPVLERMMEAVHRYEGTVNQVMGDGIMALFGAPVAHEDHAVRACYAALDLQATLHRHADELRRTHGVAVQVRVGLNSGEVVVRAIGSDLRMDYTAVGQTTHLAARMEQLATPGSVLLTADTLRLAEGYVEVKPLGPVPVKGVDAPIDVYEMVGAGARRSRLHAAAARGLTRFVGRDAELEQLRQALARAAGGHGQVVAIVGEPGVGKSRLVWEVTHSHRTHGWLIVQAGSVSYGKATPYLPVIDLIRDYCKIQDRDDPRETQERLTGKVLTLDDSLKTTLPALAALLDLPAIDPQWQTLDPPQRRQRTLDAVKRVLLRESQLRPLLVVFEDLHWIDSETQALLDGLVESLPTARMLLLVNYRPEYEHRWGSKTYYSQLRLDPLPAESATALLATLLGSDPSVEPLQTLLIARTEGNPFFLEESVRGLIETKALVGEPGTYRLAGPAETIQVPATVQAVLAARIDRLPGEDKRLLQSAAVIGKDVPLPLLEAIAETPGPGLRAGLTRLQAAEFLYEASLFPESEYTFKHALTHDVAYGSLLHERRRSLHARIVEVTEVVYAGRLAEQGERLAHHAAKGEVWDKAVRYQREAGLKAFGRSANREAVVSFERALEALAHLPESPEVARQAIDLRFDLRNSLLQVGEAEAILRRLREAHVLAEKLGDLSRTARAHAFMVPTLTWLGDNMEAVSSGERAMAIATRLEDFRLRIVAGLLLGQSYLFLGDLRRATELFRWNIASLGGERAYDRFGIAGLPSVQSRTFLAQCLADLGEFAEAVAVAEEGLKVAETADHPLSRVWAHLGVGHVQLRHGNARRAISVLERGLGVVEVASIPQLFPAIAGPLGAAYVLAGRLADAVASLEQAVARGARMKRTGGQSPLLAWLGEAYLSLERFDEAARVAHEASDLARDCRQRGNEAWAYRLLGEVASRATSSEAEAAEVNYGRAIALASELGMRPLVAHCHLGLGKLYRRSGDRLKAKEHLTTAATMYREMDMGFWFAQAEAEVKAPR
jgi:class 3 adenylate cyclase/tetratricopeptide (TPR) repeat protein